MGILDYLFLVLKESVYQKFNFYTIYMLNKLCVITLIPFDLIKTFTYNSLATFGVDSVIMSIKFLISVSLLIFIRGGLPRYRFDHLTKVGWIKFLTLVVCFLLVELLFLYTFTS